MPPKRYETAAIRGPNRYFARLALTPCRDPGEPDRRRCACIARCRFRNEGSLARSTQRDPINDVDVIVVFERSAHADWGEEGAAALPKGADVEVDAIVAL